MLNSIDNLDNYGKINKRDIPYYYNFLIDLKID